MEPELIALDAITILQAVALRGPGHVDNDYDEAYKAIERYRLGPFGLRDDLGFYTRMLRENIAYEQTVLERLEHPGLKVVS
jgi:hypothetical protein